VGLTIWVTLVAYLAFIVGLGIWSARRVRGGDDYLVAGRDVAWPLLFCTMGATAIGGGYSVGAVGKTYELGLLLLVASTGGYLHFVFSGLVVAPRFREAEVYTVAGWFEHRFGAGPRWVALVLSLGFSVLVVAAQMAAIGHVGAAILPELADSRTTLTLAVVLGGLLVVLYSTVGGLRAVILTDVFQFLVLFAGFSLTAWFVYGEVGDDWSAVRTSLPERFLSVTGEHGWVYLVSLFLTFLLGETFGPAYVTRYCSGRDTRNIQIGIAGVGAFLTLTFPVVVFFIATYARVALPDIPPDQALARVVWSLNHPVVAGLIIAALLSAVMSSGDSALNSATAIFIKDIFEHRAERATSERRTLRWARVCTALLGVGSIVVATAWTRVLDLLLFTYQIWAPGVIVPIVVGSVSRSRSPALNRSVLASMVAGPVATLLYRWTAWAEQVEPAVFGVGVSLVAFLGWWGVEEMRGRTS